MRGNFCEKFEENAQKILRARPAKFKLKMQGARRVFLFLFWATLFYFIIFFLSRAETAACVCVGVCVCVFGPWNGRKLGEIMSCRAPGTGTRSEHRERVFILRESLVKKSIYECERS